jgi:hypothetical protein
MARIVKIHCNGSGQHVNEIDLDKVLQPTPVIRLLGWRRSAPATVPERLVLKCRHCTEGRVVVTRDIIEKPTPSA